MAEKLGNGGYGPEEYSQGDGKYVADGEPNNDGSLSPADKKALQENTEGTWYDEDIFEIADDEDLDAFLDSIEDDEEDLDSFLDDIEEDEPESETFISQKLLYRIQQAGKKYELVKQSIQVEDYIDVESITEPERMIRTLVNKYHLNRKKLEQLDGEQLQNVFRSLYLIAYKQHLRREKNNENNSWNEKSTFQEKYEDLDIKDEQALIGELMPKKEAYSDFAKNTAVWITGYDVNKKTKNLVKSYTDYFWSNLSAQEAEDVKEYTGSYSWINEPLYNTSYSGKHYGKKKSQDFFETVTNITNAINKSSFPFNMWVQRGSYDSNYFPVGSNGEKVNLGSLNSEQIENLIGTSFTPGNFFSTGGAKGSGFEGKPIIFNIYCPKGTKMLYVGEHSYYSGENEIILQRGYSYKITDVRKRGYSGFFVDLEVDLSSLDNLDNSEETLKQKWINSVGED